MALSVDLHEAQNRLLFFSENVHLTKIKTQYEMQTSWKCAIFTWKIFERLVFNEKQKN
jgi:hypothetical protein